MWLELYGLRHNAPLYRRTWYHTVVHHRGAPADLAHAARVGRVALKHLDSRGSPSAAVPVYAAGSFPSADERACDRAAGPAADSDDYVEFVVSVIGVPPRVLLRVG